MAGIDIISNTTGEKIAKHLKDLVSKTLSGQPIVVTKVSEMTDASAIYLYQGEETGYENGYLYHYDASVSAWVKGSEYGAENVSVTTEEVANGTKVIITCGEESQSFIVANGIDGTNGIDGVDGKDGVDGMDKESAEEFYSSYVEENSQVMGNLNIDVNGEKQTYNGSSDVDIDIKTGEQLSAEETVLDSGTIANGTAGWSSTDMKVTLGDLRQWKMFVIRFASDMTANVYFTVGGNKVPWVCNSDCPPKFTAFLTWLDSDKTLLDVSLIKECALSEAIINDSATAMDKMLLKRQIYKSMCIINAVSTQNGVYKMQDTDILKIINNVALTADVNYEVRGVIKYA